MINHEEHREKNEARKTRKDNQHIVPRTYIKHWRISEDANFVYGIDYNNKYNRNVQKFGLDHRVFKKYKYYNHYSFENPYIIEDCLGQKIEPNYELIMGEINSEQNLSQTIREKIIQWLYFSKMRSTYFRDSTEQFVNSLLLKFAKMSSANLNADEEKEIELYSQQMAFQFQLNNFTKIDYAKNHLRLFFEKLNDKHWRILKSNPKLQFWTNDNPGFSLNIDEGFSKVTPYHKVMELNQESIIFYPLSPKYCLQISPFELESPLDICALTMDIKFEQASFEQINYINEGIFCTRNKLIISNNKEILEYCILQ